jgi:hypothetical protein
MAKYIDSEALIDRLKKVSLTDGCFGLGVQTGINHAIECVQEAPVADVVSRETYEAVEKALIAFAETDVVALPVKYGQTLWRIDGNGFRSPEVQKAVPVTVQEIVFKDVRGKPQWSFIASSTMFSFGGIGKTVFPTKEEAEKVIAKRRANNGR